MLFTNLLTEDGPLWSETRLRYNSIKCIKVVGNKHILSSYAQHGMKGIKNPNIALCLTILVRYVGIYIMDTIKLKSNLNKGKTPKT
jgi:hypothetical protein